MKTYEKLRNRDDAKLALKAMKSVLEDLNRCVTTLDIRTDIGNHEPHETCPTREAQLCRCTVSKLMEYIVRARTSETNRITEKLEFSKSKDALSEEVAKTHLFRVKLERQLSDIGALFNVEDPMYLLNVIEAHRFDQDKKVAEYKYFVERAHTAEDWNSRTHSALTGMAAAMGVPNPKVSHDLDIITMMRYKLKKMNETIEKLEATQNAGLEGPETESDDGTVKGTKGLIEGASIYPSEGGAG